MANRCLSIYIGLSTTTWVLMRLENPEYVSNVAGLSMLSGLGGQTDIQNKCFRYSG
jgi:hypothetical protein